MNDIEYCEKLRIETATLSLWVEQRWIVPHAADEVPVFLDADIARGRLILDLIDAMGVNEDGIDIVMELVDQIHGLRGKLQDVLDAVNSQDEPIRRQIGQRLAE